MALLIAALLALAPGIAAADVTSPPPPSEQLAPLTLVLAGQNRGEVFMLVSSSDVWLPVDAFKDARIHLPASAKLRTIQALDYVSMHSLTPGLTYLYDERTLTVTVSVKDPSLIENGTQAFDLQQTPPKTAGAHADTSGFLNYSVTEGVANVAQTGAFTELGFANEAGHATATAAYTQSDFRRGLIAYSQDDERDLRRETIGDELAYSGYLGSSVIVGGIGYSRVFALQPGFIRDPSPALSGTVLTPTQADVYINGALYRTIVLQPGQFSLSNLPVPQGANVTQVVLRDATGQTTDLTAAYYSAQSALRQGVNEYSYHIGFPRLQPFASNDQYGPLAAIGFYRVGVTNEVTLGATFEKMTGDGQVDGGPTLDLRLPFGTLNLASSFSSAGHASGFADSIAYTYVSRRFTLSVYDVMRSDDYSTVTLAPQNDRTTSAVGESAGLTLTRRLNVTLSHVDTHYRDESPTDQTSLITNVIANSRATLQFIIERGTGSPLNPTQKNSNTPYWTVGTSLLLNIGSSGLATIQAADAGGQRTTSVEYQKLAPAGLGLGYDVAVNAGAVGTVTGSAIYKSQFFDANALFQGGAAGTSASATLAGGIAFFRQGVFFTEPIQSAYGLVHVDGLQNAPVYLNNVLVGTTGRRGDAIVSNLGPYIENPVTLGSLDSETNAVADVSRQPLNPRFYSGVNTTFHIRRILIFVGTLSIQESGKTFAPAYGSLTVEVPGEPLRSDLGSNGEFYFENLPPGSFRATASYSGGGSCSFLLLVPKSESLQTSLGSIICSVP